MGKQNLTAQRPYAYNADIGNGHVSPICVPAEPQEPRTEMNLDEWKA